MLKQDFPKYPPTDAKDTCSLVNEGKFEGLKGEQNLLLLNKYRRANSISAIGERIYYQYPLPGNQNPHERLLRTRTNKDKLKTQNLYICTQSKDRIGKIGPQPTLSPTFSVFIILFRHYLPTKFPFLYFGQNHSISSRRHNTPRSFLLSKGPESSIPPT